MLVNGGFAFAFVGGFERGFLRGAQSKLAIPRMSVAQHCGLARALVQGSNWPACGLRASRATSSAGMAVAMETVTPTRAAMSTEKRMLALGLRGVWNLGKA